MIVDMIDYDMVATIMNATDVKRDRVGFAGLNDAERVVSCISYARFEIDNGGFSQFYYNTAGTYAKQTVWALEQIGAVEVAAIFQRANGLFPNGDPPNDRAERWSALQEIRLRSTADDAFDAFDREFYEAPEDLDELLYNFILKHRKALPGNE
jgi:hypothetical protein